MTKIVFVRFRTAEDKLIEEVPAPARTFSTGKEGFGYYSKMTIDGERYQVSLNIVKIVPK